MIQCSSCQFEEMSWTSSKPFSQENGCLYKQITIWYIYMNTKLIHTILYRNDLAWTWISQNSRPSKWGCVPFWYLYASGWPLFTPIETSFRGWGASSGRFLYSLLNLENAVKSWIPDNVSAALISLLISRWSLMWKE